MNEGCGDVRKGNFGNKFFKGSDDITFGGEGFSFFIYIYIFPSLL